MDKRQILILLKIGGIDVSQKCVEDVSVDRNFSDVGDKFSITLIDTPDTNVTYDLELYMASGYRSISLKYGDLGTSKLVAYNGTIWDYTNTFVGNMKKLTITGIMNRYTESTKGVANSIYNIDWNSYYNIRHNESEPYGAMKAILRNRELTNQLKTYTQLDENNEIMRSVAANQISSAILDSKYQSALQYNTKTMPLKGISGETINLPVPDCFFHTTVLPKKINADTIANLKRSEYPEFYDMIKDPNDKYWGELTTVESTSFQARAEHLCIPLADQLIFGNTEGDPFYYNIPVNADINNLPKNMLPKIAGVAFLIDTFPTLGYDFNEIMNWSDTNFLNKHTERFYYYHWDIVKNLKIVDSHTRTPVQAGMDTFEKFILALKNTKGLVTDIFDLSSLAFKKANIQTEQTQDSTGITTDYVIKDLGSKKKGEFPIAFKTGTAGPFVFLAGLDNELNLSGDLRNQLNNLKHDYISNKLDLSEQQKLNYDDDTETYYFYSSDDYDLGPTAQNKFLRGFIMKNGDTGESTFYLQANPEKISYGGAGFVSSGSGVNISDIVYKLAKLEGWQTKPGYIVPTELVPNSDNFVMQGQTAMDFIIKNLVPHSVTPIGEYTLLDGSTKFITTPQGGFYPFFDDDGYFHYQPITEQSTKDLNIPNLGYNLPNSPVLSFQINTKGTAFYTNNDIDYNPISIVTGTKFDNLQVVSDAVTDSISSASYHNDTFDAWLGVTFEDAKGYLKSSDTLKTFRSDDLKLRDLGAYAQGALITKTDALITNLKTDLTGSAEMSGISVLSKIERARNKIQDSTIKASLSMWGNFEVAPARNITVTNMLKGGINNTNQPVKHPSSGKYMILSMQDKIDAGGFIQNLNLLRVTTEVKNSINKYNIDYTKAPVYKVNEIAESDYLGFGGSFSGGGGFR